MSFRDYLTVARERWGIVLLGILVGIGAGAGFAFLSTPKYVASVEFFISTPDQAHDLNQAYQGSLLSEQKIKSYVDLASDRRIREQVSAQLGSTVVPGTLSASAKPDTVLMTVSATDPYPQRAQAIVNLAAKEFVNLVAEVEKPGTNDQLVVAREVQPAELPTKPVSPRPGVDLGLGVVLGLIAGMAAAVARQTLDRSIKSPDALGELVGAPVLGSTQYDPGIRSQPLIVHDHPRAPLAEAFRQLRTNLDYVGLDKSNKLIVITSALPNEGKTVTACNLAIAMAQSGNKVVIVEADLRRPKAAQYLGMENAVGLTSVLTGQVPLDLALQPWRGGMLDFLGAGPLPPNPSELLASSQMAALLVELRSKYTTVIFDAAPTLPVADAAVLAAQCDGVLLIARHSYARADQVQAAAETIRRVAAPIFGVVLSMTRTKQEGGYAYQYGYTYKNSERVAPGGQHVIPRQERSGESTTQGTVILPSTTASTKWPWPDSTVPAPRIPATPSTWQDTSYDDVGWDKPNR